MKIVADENMPLVRELFSPYGEVTTCPGRDLDSEQVRDADVLLVRSITRINAALLEGSRVRFVGSATIGVDHVDLHYLNSRKIAFANAPGCNANAVVQYVLSALFRVRPDWLRQTVGIVGCGNVGGRLYRTLKALGVDCRCYDPFLTLDQISDKCSFEEVLDASILCLHTPLTTTGSHPTYHLFDEQVLRRFSAGGLLLNAGRGAVVDNAALLKLMPEYAWQVVLDVWEDEPAVSLPLLQAVNIGTPHIAGYSWDGKVNGSRMVRDALCNWLGEAPAKDTEKPEIIDLIQMPTLPKAVLTVYDVADDDRQMRAELMDGDTEVGVAFDQLRKSYPRRLEFQHYRVRGCHDHLLAAQLAAMGFRST
ncbi:MAG: 4-phosphoerythronate dehydrogenase [Gammaproteobacteria bacterium]|nr:MAG: 4-phosphoerythronate dehydrogenase [Gammaproteobacteria bacterium]